MSNAMRNTINAVDVAKDPTFTVDMFIKNETEQLDPYITGKLLITKSRILHIFFLNLLFSAMFFGNIKHKQYKKTID